MEANPYEWPSVENLGVMVHKHVTDDLPAWWLEVAEANSSTTAQWQAYEKLDGTNVAMVASTGSLLGRHFKIADDKAFYQCAPLGKLRAQAASVEAVGHAMLEMLPEAVRGGCQVVLYGELLVEPKYNYHERAESHRAGDWFVFGAGIMAKPDDLNEIQACLLQHSLAAKQYLSGVFVFLSDAFASLLQDASAGKLRTPQPLCPPYTNIYDLVTALEPHLTGTAALNTEGAILVGLQGQKLVDVFKYKTSHCDASSGRRLLGGLLAADDVTKFDAHTLKLMQAIHAVATANGLSPWGTKAVRGVTHSGHVLLGFQAAFDSALTKMDAVTVWSASKELLQQAIAYITAQVQADLITPDSTEQEVKAVRIQVRKAVGQMVAASRKAKAAGGGGTMSPCHAATMSACERPTG